MIYSKTLCKNYKTPAALKGQLTKYIKAQQSEFDEIEKMIEKGSRWYLGVPIHRQRRERDLDLIRAKRELERL